MKDIKKLNEEAKAYLKSQTEEKKSFEGEPLPDPLLPGYVALSDETTDTELKKVPEFLKDIQSSLKIIGKLGEITLDVNKTNDECNDRDTVRNNSKKKKKRKNLAEFNTGEFLRPPKVEFMGSDSEAESEPEELIESDHDNDEEQEEKDIINAVANKEIIEVSREGEEEEEEEQDKNVDEFINDDTEEIGSSDGEDIYSDDDYISSSYDDECIDSDYSEDEEYEEDDTVYVPPDEESSDDYYEEEEEELVDSDEEEYNEITEESYDEEYDELSSSCTSDDEHTRFTDDSMDIDDQEYEQQKTLYNKKQNEQNLRIVKTKTDSKRKEKQEKKGVDRGEEVGEFKDLFKIMYYDCFVHDGVCTIYGLQNKPAKERKAYTKYLGFMFHNVSPIQQTVKGYFSGDQDALDLVMLLTYPGALEWPDSSANIPRFIATKKQCYITGKKLTKKNKRYIRYIYINPFNSKDHTVYEDVVHCACVSLIMAIYESCHVMQRLFEISKHDIKKRQKRLRRRKKKYTSKPDFATLYNDFLTNGPGTQLILSEYKRFSAIARKIGYLRG